jgi:hypothetical protein
VKPVDHPTKWITHQVDDTPRIQEQNENPPQYAWYNYEIWDWVSYTWPPSYHTINKEGEVVQRQV